jgi:O-antigen/teichoic acid export membrane protein
LVRQQALSQAVEPARDGRWLARQGALAFVLSGSTLSVNLVTGVVIARALGADGRGELAAVVAAMSVIGWLFAMGARDAITYHQAKRPQDAPRLMATWFALVGVFAALGIAAGEAVLPSLLAAQSDALLDIARLYMFMVLGMLVGDVAYGTLFGDHDFLFINVMRLVQPAATAIAFVALWSVERLSVGTALLAMVVASLADVGIALTRVLRRHGLGKPNLRLARTTLSYGLRAHGTSTAAVVNGRLDLMIIPAFLAASSVGLYAVATSVSWIVVAVPAVLGELVFPAATRRSELSTPIIARSLQAVLGIGVLVAAAIAALAEIGVRIVYGGEFAGAALPLRILLPGCVLLAGAGVLVSGLYALNRPFSAALSNAAGTVITVVGLVLFLKSGGIAAAAIVSTVSYSVVFLLLLGVYCAVAGVRWADLLPSTADLQTLRRAASRVLEARAS